jgi:hypothetical protein
VREQNINIETERREECVLKAQSVGDQHGNKEEHR